MTLQKMTEKEMIASPNKPENFRGNEPGYYPERIVGETVRVKNLNGLIEEFCEDNETIRKRLSDLIIYNSYGRVFPSPNHAADIIGVVDGEKNSKLKNCIAMVIVKGKLAIVGGFNDMGEAITQTGAREASEEIGAKNIKGWVFVGERSDPVRDNRFVVVSTCMAGIVDPSEVLAGDDAEKVVFLPLIDESGDLNDSFFDGGTYTDALGKDFSHTGLRADHGETLRNFYFWWKEHGRDKGLSLAQTLKLMSAGVPQNWFEGYKVHPSEAEKYETLSVDEKKLLLTPNVQFTLEKVKKIFTEAGLENFEQKAKLFVFKCIEADVLPLFPQAALTVDCVIFKGDRILVHRLPDGRFALPGSFVSHEKDEAGKTIEVTAKEVIFNKYGLDFSPNTTLGTVGGLVATGEEADKRYPRLSVVKVGTVSAAYSPTPKTLPTGSQIVEVNIWKDKEKGVLSEEITQAIWAYSHSKEIIQTLVLGFLKTLDPQGKYTAEQLVRRQRN